MNTPYISRRDLVKTTGLSIVGATSLATSARAQTNDNREIWGFETDRAVISSPTVIDETVFVGSLDTNVYAIDAEEGEQQWSASTSGEIWSSPTVADDTLFIGSGGFTIAGSNLYAFDATSGEQQWVFETNDWIQSSPTVVDGTVFVGGYDSSIYAIDAGSGEEQWNFETGGDILSSPTVVDGTLFIGSNDANVYALDANTGEQRWKFNTDREVWSSPTVADGMVFVGDRGGTVYALNIDSGVREWGAQLNPGIGRSSPTVYNDTLFIGGGGETVYALDLSKGNVNWTFSTEDSVSDSSPTIADNTVFIGDASGRVYALDSENGTTQWVFTINDTVQSSPTVVDGSVFIGSNDGNLYALEAGVESSSEGTRTALGTLGHHDNWEYAGQSFTQSQTQPTGSSDFIMIGGAAGAVALVGGYTLLRRSRQDQTSDDATDLAESEPKQNEQYQSSSSETGDTSADDGINQYESAIGQATNSLDSAEQSYKADKYDQVIEDCDKGLSHAREAASIAERQGLNTKLTEADTLIEDIISLKQKAQTEKEKSQIQAAIDEIENKITGVREEVKKEDIPVEHGQIRSIESKLQELETQLSTSDHEFDDLKKQLDDSVERFEKLQNQIGNTENVNIPETVPTSPQLSVEYEDIKKSEPLGSGGNADVYLATIEGSGPIKLAIKEPRMSGTIDTATIDQMLEEAETWQQLDDHNYIVSVVDYGSDPLPWIGMEYMDGGDLSERSGKLSFEQALWTALAITKGVRHAHSRGIIHLDLKPENILFRSVENAWDVPKVADWGLSKQLLEHSKSVDGMSPHYAAPEQFDTDVYGQTNNVTDVYQLGAVFYELFTGRPPFEGQTFEVIDKIRNEEPTPPSQVADISAEIDDILLTALATEKTDRYEDVLYLRDELQNLWDEYSN